MSDDVPPPPPPDDTMPPPPPPPPPSDDMPPPPPPSDDMPPPPTSNVNDYEGIDDAPPIANEEDDANDKKPLPEKIPDDSLSEKDRERQRFIRRVLMLKNPFDVLGGEPEDSLDQLKKRFKKAALLIHPDKCSLPRTTDAFDKLGKAMKKLEDDDLRESFAQMIVKARRDLLADEKLAAMSAEQQEAHRIELVNKALHRFEQHVTTAQKYRNANSKWEKQRKMEERDRAKAQEEHEKQWDATRDTRVDSWRSFVGGSDKKAKRLLAKPPKPLVEKRKADVTVARDDDHANKRLSSSSSAYEK